MDKTLSRSFIVLIICLSTGALVSTDIFLPALDTMAGFYHVKEDEIQKAIAVFMLGLSFSQLIYGPLSDRFGRKNILLVGLFIWLFSTVAVIYTTHINQLLFLRLVQGVGSCAGLTISRAIINDVLEKKQAGQLYLVIFPFVGMSPAIAPIIGGTLSHYFGWQACFVFLTLFILLTLTLCFTTLKETLPASKRMGRGFFSTIEGTIAVLCNRKFLFYSLIPCFAYGVYFSYLVESPFLLTRLGLPDFYIGYTYVTLSAAYISGNLVAKRVSRLRGIEGTLAIGYAFTSVGGVIFMLQMFFSPFALLTSILSISIVTFGNGFLMPLGTASAIAAHSHASGTASGVMGALQLGAAAFATFVIGTLTGHEPHYVALIILTYCLGGAFIYFVGYARHLRGIEAEVGE
ncbi:multidrug effflux MFS transporter [Bartonella sp. DGB2]|uniref:multidrug effflux MFS transporter n=1 Tax=Bartonella sp. DGB2 TaxID=3388426 RepID=UPI00398FCDBA